MTSCFRVLIVIGVVVVAAGGCSPARVDVCADWNVENGPLFGERNAVVCRLRSGLSIDDVLDRSVFGAKPGEPLIDRLGRLGPPVTTRQVDGDNWVVVQEPQARLEAACVTVRSGQEGECIWHLKAFPARSSQPVLKAGLERLLDDFGMEPFSLSLERTDRGPRQPDYRIVFRNGEVAEVQWRDPFVPSTFRLPH